MPRVRVLEAVEAADLAGREAGHDTWRWGFRGQGVRGVHGADLAGREAGHGTWRGGVGVRGSGGYMGLTWLAGKLAMAPRGGG